MLNRRGHLLVALLALTLAINACTSIQLSSNYDEAIDSQAQQLQKKLDTYFISLQSAGVEDLKYKSQQKFYEGVLADLNAMSIRASGIYKNKLTIKQIDLAKENLAYLALLHKQCVTAPLTEDQKKKVKDNGVDLSMDCKIENGATANATDRSETSINRSVIAPVQALFNQHAGTIMALELAKKRGEDQSK
uniref:Lipoprotein n=1 Tax=Candidatus Kentrum eta TaxID=2126337 RepID=A0A450VB02_9GAMM|nr:MAG: hypothetical protein BECKH772A_GA0070896_1008011 [Candidatus Kentron sp. H]VFJ95909.1 MAG: hypothetical protein BECKH772B_GA0070898_1008412 [Candidatus Kentron sp. H]VFK01951.1 MAG: hypothetical protein BECKH772C_GA0070978_1007711 [Candidatus Kentron sp. H]